MGVVKTLKKSMCQMKKTANFNAKLREVLKLKFMYKAC